ncbi:MAG: ATP-dependent protease LonB [Syntrophaceticus sp.]|jgi:Lon-like ATP-dependent protease|nr:ATP-dependent protease LonB [Syntrophaceticus sp.]MDD4783730.1 ATP-dependent protease LonB [Syntrophaceticus sp.]HBG21856.1 ATP-dependent protease LonB [Peptococcaceae bacterium]
MGVVVIVFNLGFSDLVGAIQIFFVIVVGLYFWNLLRSQQGTRVAVDRESKKEMEKIQRLRKISLAEPLSERTRPQRFEEIVGQEDGLKALRAALCGNNPQHVLIYGPPGVGKTAAARVVLEDAKINQLSPFAMDAKFVEVDATIARFDERGIADPLIGSVHDPIYQGAGAMGVAGIPQPKPGAVTKAHGGILFIDEIGELHSIQLNKLLKVLEDRKVFLESSYYNAEDTNIPVHIHDVFQNGLPADFRLIGATTRLPDEISPAIRSRCVEIFFRSLLPEEIRKIALNAAERVGFILEPGVLDVVDKYAGNGREAVNIIQIAAGLSQTRENKEILVADVEWIVNSGQYSPRLERKIPAKPAVGLVNGLAVMGPNLGTLLEIEVSVSPPLQERGEIKVTGIVEEEEMGGLAGRRVRCKSMIRNSVDNALTTLRSFLDVDPRSYDIHINFPGGVPTDGPSAGVAIAVGIYSAITKKKVDHRIAMTGEISLLGDVKPVGGVVAKVEAAHRAGAKKVLIPQDNWQDIFREAPIEVIPVKYLKDVIRLAFLPVRRTSQVSA